MRVTWIICERLKFKPELIYFPLHHDFILLHTDKPTVRRNMVNVPIEQMNGAVEVLCYPRVSIRRYEYSVGKYDRDALAQGPFLQTSRAPELLVLPEACG